MNPDSHARAVPCILEEPLPAKARQNGLFYQRIPLLTALAHCVLYREVQIDARTEEQAIRRKESIRTLCGIADLTRGASYHARYAVALCPCQKAF
jgi:hypothetical protein